MGNFTEDEFEQALGMRVWKFSMVHSPFQITDLVDKSQVINTAHSLLALTYDYSTKELPAIIDENLTQLPGGEN